MENLSLDIDQSDVGSIEFIPEIQALVTKIRNTAKMFRKSPVSNDLLQKYIKNAEGKRLHLLLDVRTRSAPISC